jgi:Cu/Ag efflux protein CusF
MNRVVASSLVALCSVIAVLPAVAQKDMKGMDMKGMDMKGMDMKGMDMKDSDKDKQAGAHKASGTVSKVDAAKGTVTIAHGPVESMKWPSMTMTFKAKEKAMVSKLKEGDKIDFSFVKSGKDYVVTDVKK